MGGRVYQHQLGPAGDGAEARIGGPTLDQSALGMPENQPRSRQLLDGEQVKLLADHAMIALLGFSLLVQVVVEVFLVERANLMCESDRQLLHFHLANPLVHECPALHRAESPQSSLCPSHRR